MIKRITAAFVALTLGVALALVGASAAQAHTAGLSAAVACNAADGSATVTWTITNDYNEVMDVTASSKPAVVPLTTTLPATGQNGPNTKKTFTETIPAPAAGLSSTLTLSFLWEGDNYTQKNTSVTSAKVSNTCGDTPDSSKITFCHYDEGQGGKYTSNTTSVSVFFDKGHLQHANDIYPAGTYIKNGVTHTWNAQGDQSLLQWDDCLAVNAAASVSVTTATCTAAAIVTWTGLVNATGGVLDQTPGTHNAVATATAHHAFPAGTGVSADGKTKTISYTIVDKLSGNNCLATATLTPATSCTANSTQTPTVTHATLTSGALHTTPGNYSATFTADNGYHFSNNSSTLVIPYTIVGPLGYQNANPTAPCYKTVDVVPTFPTATGPTCATAGSLPALPTNQTGITFTWAQDGLTMVATPKTGYSFAGGTITTHLYTTPGGATGYQNTNPDAPCYQTVPVTPSFPSPSGPTCDAAGSLPALPTGQTGIVYSWAPDGLTMIATATAGYYFPGGTDATHLYSAPADAIGYQNSNPEAPCFKALPVTPSFPDASGPTCTEGGSLPDLPTGQTGIVYSWAPDGLTMVATPTLGYYFPDGTVASHLYSQPADAIGYQNTNPDAPCYKLVDVSGAVNHDNQTCSVDSALVGGSITVTITDHVTYVITDSSNATVPFDATTGKTGPLAPDTYTVAVSADTGYNLTSPSSVQVVVSAYGDQCGHVDASVSPGASAHNQTCNTDAKPAALVNGYITVNVTTGIDYVVKNAANTVIPFNPLTGDTALLPVGDYTVTPTAQAGFVLTSDAVIPLTIGAYTGVDCFQEPTDATVDPSAVQVQLGCSTAGSYTLTSDQIDPTAVIWTVNGSVVAQGTYTVTTPGSYHIVAAPNAPKWGFDLPVPPWDFVFTAPTTCDLKTLALTGSSPGSALVLGGFAVLFGLALVFRAERRRKTARG